jgi:mRNA interferase MazF
MEQGEVWLAYVSGPAGQRPVVILTRSRIIPYLTNLTVAPITRSVRQIPTHVPLLRQDGLDHDSVATLDNIMTIPKSAFSDKIVRLRHEKMDQIFAAIRAAFDMPR